MTYKQAKPSHKMCTLLRTVSQKFKMSSAKSRSPTLACDTVRSVVSRSSSYRQEHKQVSLSEKLGSRQKQVHSFGNSMASVKHGTKKTRLF